MLPTGTITFLFTDIQSSTRLLQRLGDGYPRVLSDHHRILREAIEAAGGLVVGTEGDAVFAAFRSAPAAVAVAAAAQRDLSGHEWPEHAEVRVRMGLHTGEGIVSDQTYVGIDVHRTARIAAAAHGGQVLLSEATRALCQGTLPEEIGLLDLGEHRLKDLDRAEHLYQLLIPGLQQEFPPIRSLEATPSNLPPPTTSFVGRVRELAEVERLLEEARLLTLTGPGGTGKTRLAVQAASRLLGRFEDGVFFVALAPITDAALVPSTIAQTLGIQELGDRPPQEILEESLRTKEVLLVLDNLEQVLDAAPLVSDLLAAARRLKVLATSREPLHLSGEQEFEVPPLGLPDLDHLPRFETLSQYDAVALFIQRARAVEPSFAVTADNASAMAEICHRLDGLPLAIELAAARVKLFPPDVLLPRLEHRLTVLRGGPKDLPARQQTLRDAIGWSYGLLGADEQALFRRLGVFVGGFTLPAAEAVVDPDRALDVDLLDGLASLVDKSLVRRGRPVQGQPRFWMLETIREFARERLGEEGEAGEVTRRHAAEFLRAAEEAEPHLTEDPAWLDRVDADHDNLREAIRWAIHTSDAETGLRIAGALWRFWHLRGHFTEGRAWLEELLSLPAAASHTAGRARGLSARGSLAYWQGDYPLAQANYEEAMAIRRELGDERGIAEELYNLAYVAALMGDHPTARDRYTVCRDIYERLGDRRMAGYAMVGLAMVTHLDDDSDAALELAESALPLLVESGDRWAIANANEMVGRIRSDLGDLAGAEPLLRRGLSGFAEVGDVSGIAYTLDDIGTHLVRRGKLPEAIRLAGAAEMLRDMLGAAAPATLVPKVDVIAHARGRLDEAETRAGWEEGRAMSLDQAVAFALDRLEP